MPPKLIMATTEYLKGKETTDQKIYRRIVSEDIKPSSFLPSSRSGNDLNPYNIHCLEEFAMPEMSKVYNISFADATDARCNDIIKLAKGNNLPIVVAWSGGIDSTVIVSAIIKHFNPELKKRVIILMNDSSYFENPSFFNNHIRSVFKYTNQKTYDWHNSIYITGQPADPLWVQANIIEIDAIQEKQSIILLKDNKDFLLHFISNSDTKFSKWVHSLVINNALSAGIELKTISDFFWWLNFNFMYTGNALGNIIKSTKWDETSWELFRKYSIPWYNSEKYQSWSIYSQLSGEKYNGVIANYKIVAKEYIYSVDKNKWLLYYKTKTASVQHDFVCNIIALFDDGSIIRKQWNTNQ